MERRVPKQLAKTKTPARAKETANAGLAAGDYTEGLCPVCNTPMVTTSLKQNMDRPVYVCLAHRVCLPLSAKE